jgi:hypothetical protein
MSVFLYSSRQTGLDTFASSGFPSLQSFVIPIWRCSHMTGFAEQLCICFHIFSSGTAGFDVMQIELPSTAASLTFRSTLCHHFFFDDSPLLIVVRIAKPDIAR